VLFIVSYRSVRWCRESWKLRLLVSQHFRQGYNPFASETEFHRGSVGPPKGFPVRRCARLVQLRSNGACGSGPPQSGFWNKFSPGCFPKRGNQFGVDHDQQEGRCGLIGCQCAGLSGDAAAGAKPLPDQSPTAWGSTECHDRTARERLQLGRWSMISTVVSASSSISRAHRLNRQPGSRG
jgi:hypothetical protein